MVLSGRVLGQAAILEGKNVVQTQCSYGDSQRGGLSVSEIIVDSGEIIFQQVRRPDIILALSERAIKKYANAGLGATVLYDSTVLDLGEGEFLHAIPFSELAAKLEAGAANMIALGAIIALTEVVSFDSLAKSLRQSFAEASAIANIESVRAGMEVAKALDGKRVLTT